MPGKAVDKKRIAAREKSDGTAGRSGLFLKIFISLIRSPLRFIPGLKKKGGKIAEHNGRSNSTGCGRNAPGQNAKQSLFLNALFHPLRQGISKSGQGHGRTRAREFHQGFIQPQAGQHNTGRHKQNQNPCRGHLRPVDQNLPRGEIGVLVARALADKNLEGIYISNRTHKKAQELAYELGGEAILFDEFSNYLKSADVVISATGAPHYVILEKTIREVLSLRSGKPLFMVDIANPRDIEETVGELDGVTLCNIDNLRVVSEKTLKMRNEEAKKVIAIIHEELILLGKQYKRQRADDIISELYRNVYDIREEEKQKAAHKFRVKHTIGEFEETILENLTHSIANQILAEPTKVLRDAAESDDDELLDAVARVFKIKRTSEK